MRLIDADAYENEMSKAYGDDWDKSHILESMPTVEQKHGHWIDTGNGMKCSFCSLFWDYYYWSSPMFEKFDWMMNYCPSCGAKMDGKCEVENVTNNT